MQKTFYGLDKKSVYKVWNISVKAGPAGDAYLTISHGKEDGKLTEKVDYFGAGYGKQGRTPYEQAISEAEGRIKKQTDKGYRENKDDLGKLPLLAMLAGDYNKIGHRIDYEGSSCGVYVSDKMDGVRCLAKCELIDSAPVVILESRTGQPYSVPHIEEELLSIMDIGDILDGELYKHGEVLQDITSAVKRTDPALEIHKAYNKTTKLPVGTPQYYEAVVEYAKALDIGELRDDLEFIIFDYPSKNKLFDERAYDLENLETKLEKSGKVKVLDYKMAFDEAQMKKYHADAVSRGFEGVMIRNPFGEYESGKRSANLQKYKTFVDSEFNILDVVPDKQGNGVFVCKNDLNDKEFQVVMGSMAERLSYLENKESLKGKYLTVKYQSRYKDTLLPQFPVGLQIREGNVINGEFVPSE